MWLRGSPCALYVQGRGLHSSNQTNKYTCVDVCDGEGHGGRGGRSWGVMRVGVLNYTVSLFS